MAKNDKNNNNSLSHSASAEDISLSGEGGDEVKTGKKGLRRWVWFGCVLLVVAASMQSATLTIGGNDTWVAMACGRYQLGPWAMEDPGRTWQMKLLDEFGVHITWCDPFSATSRPYYPDDKNNFGWVNQNWLTHVLFYKMKTAYGGDEFGPQKGEFLIVIYKFVQAVLTGLFIYWAARVLGAHPLIAAGTVAFGMLLSRSFIDLRPNVSSSLFAAIMILILAYWKKGCPWAVLWMIPVMIVWSNVHGGFIYAIMIFVIMLSANLVQQFFESAEFWPGRFFRPGVTRIKGLVAGLVTVVVVPAIFSPFGLENLLHPLVVATGKEGKQWRGVSEWLPIWNWQGFGNATPYIVYVSLGGVILLIWLMAFLPKPKLAQSRRRSRKKTITESFPWPTIDLAFLGVMGITLLMSLLSRRFIFLGGVVLAPFLAVLFQEIVNMVQIRKSHKRNLSLELKPLPGKFILPGVLASILATAIMVGVFYNSIEEIYIKSEPKNMSMFRKMVGVGDQPVDAIKYFDILKIKGVVFNEWTHGGFVAFGQTPDAKTGEPPCKVYMDGRAQAAYTLEHYLLWRELSSDGKLLGQPLAVADRLKQDIAILQSVKTKEKVKKFLRDRQSLYPIWFSKYYSRWYNNLNKEEILSVLKPTEEENRRVFAKYEKANLPEKWFDKIDEENINVVLLDATWQKSESIVALFKNSDRWAPVYPGRYYLLLRRDHELNKESFELIQKLNAARALKRAKKKAKTD
ncbi:MAG: hypothetical protein JXD22_10210 [Sedimentisphaerales bacterium]|nr:hypothetical protein [Sedimentisphaerales bacterium]